MSDGGRFWNYLGYGADFIRKQGCRSYYLTCRATYIVGHPGSYSNGLKMKSKSAEGFLDFIIFRGKVDFEVEAP